MPRACFPPRALLPAIDALFAALDTRCGTGHEAWHPARTRSAVSRPQWAPDEPLQLAAYAQARLSSWTSPADPPCTYGTPPRSSTPTWALPQVVRVALAGHFAQISHRLLQDARSGKPCAPGLSRLMRCCALPVRASDMLPLDTCGIPHVNCRVSYMATGTPPTTIRLSADDRELIEQLKKRFGIRSDASHRLALRMLSEQPVGSAVGSTPPKTEADR